MKYTVHCSSGMQSYQLSRRWKTAGLAFVRWASQVRCGSCFQSEDAVSLPVASNTERRRRFSWSPHFVPRVVLT